LPRRGRTSGRSIGAFPVILPESSRNQPWRRVCSRATDAWRGDRALAVNGSRIVWGDLARALGLNAKTQTRVSFIID
jgi:hypothetical protein